MPVRLAMVCEAEADFRTASRLAERVFIEANEWVKESLEHCPIWLPCRDSRPFLLWRDVKHVAKELDIKPKGLIDGSCAEPDAYAARKALLVLQFIHRNPPLDGIILIRDDDGDTRRRQGLEQGRAHFKMHEINKRIVIGLAHCKRECWVLAGFDPVDSGETDRLSKVRRELGFDPRTTAHELTAKGDDDTRSAKRVLARLVGYDPKRERESQCVERTDLQVLWNRGEKTGLCDYLEQIRERLVPVFGLNGPGGA